VICCTEPGLTEALYIHTFNVDIDVLAAIGLMAGGGVYVRMYTKQVQHTHTRAHRKTTASTSTQNKQEHPQKKKQ
jgi:hypothetical protein